MQSKQDATATQTFSPQTATTTLFNLSSMVAQPALTNLSGGLSTKSAFEVRQYKSQEYFRTKHDYINNNSYLLLLEQGSNTLYLVNPALEPNLSGDAFRGQLLLAVNRDGEFFVIFCRVPSYPTEPFAITRLEGVEAAKTKWVRLRTKADRQGYDIIVANGAIPEPVWPDEPVQTILEKAFGDRFIMDLNHSVLRKLRGEL
jgi:hypothetical protein